MRLSSAHVHTLRPALLLALVALALAACNLRDRVATPAAATSVERTLESGGVTRRYLLHVPASYQAGQATSLVLDFHGFSATPAEEQALSRMSRKADEAGFIVAYPEGRDKTWASGPSAEGETDVAFVRDLIDALSGDYTIDPARVYATGISNGGGMVNRLGCDLSDHIAAIAPVSGAYLGYAQCTPARAVPDIAFHGTADQIVPYGGEGRALPPVHDWAAAWAARNGCDAAPAVTFQQSDVTAETWSDCRDSADVVLYTITGQGHTWPGSGLFGATRTIDATDLIWTFLAEHPMPQR
jgi:polyhydroxybutyrate depolymerase